MRNMKEQSLSENEKIQQPILNTFQIKSNKIAHKLSQDQQATENQSLERHTNGKTIA